MMAYAPTGCVAWLLAGIPTAFATTQAETIDRYYIREYRVQGAKLLKSLEIEEAVYPFLGPGRTADDVEQARLALEKTFHDKGLQTVSVVIPQQDPRRGVIRMEVVEGKVGRLRVNGARYHLPSKIASEVPSLAEGGVPDMNRVGKEIVAVNRLADRRVTPQIHAGALPGTVDVDLNVEDKLPLHGSLELNNRYSANTTSLRLNGALSYGNLFQLGHTIGLNYQIAPENIDDAKVMSGFYLARVSPGISLMLQATKQNSDISTLGGAAVGGNGSIVGARALFDLPTTATFYQTCSLGLDYKDFQEDILIGKDKISSPIHYFPLSATYSGSVMREDSFTEINAGINLHLRGLGSGVADYSNKRYNADGDYIYLRGDVSHTRDLKNGAQLHGKVQAQIASQPLVNGEQFAGGGLDTARGYLEGTALGDNAIFGTAEYRSPSLIGKPGKNGPRESEWRFHAFADAGTLGIHDPLPGQQQRFNFLSAGAGTRFRVLNHYNGSLDAAVPIIGQTDADAGDVRITFRGWVDF